jgi:tetratricopeptide (TPR) repeat protein
MVGSLHMQRSTQRGSWVVLGTICALMIGFFAGSARPGWLGMRTWRAQDAYYNLLVQGLRAGQLNLKTEVPAGLAQLADPYDPAAIAGYLLADGHPMWDLSYYHGKLYFYFGITPALVLFGPWAVLTGHYLGHVEAVVIFCAIGYLASVGLLCLVWRRYFPEVHLAVVAAGTLALGLAVFTPVILPRAEVYEVAISCGYALGMLALLALWGACHRPHQRGRWLALASLANGLTIGARPTALFGAVILLVPVALAWRERKRQKEEGRKKKAAGGDTQPAARNRAPSQIANRPSSILVLLFAAAGPITCVGLGLMLYNQLRFDSPFEFGTAYQWNDLRTSAQHFWSLHFVGSNFWYYFLAPAHGRDLFPFIPGVNLPLGSKTKCYAEHPFGVLIVIPLVWLALAAPLAWRGRSGDARSPLRGFLAAVALFAAARALILGPYAFAFVRYEWEFCPLLVLLAGVGILGLERALAGRPGWRWAVRCGWGLLLAFSVAFNLLASVLYHAEYQSKLGSLLVPRGQVSEGIVHYQKALALQPDDAVTHYNLGCALGLQGRTDEAIRQFQEALRLKPDYPEARINLGSALGQSGQTDEAIRQFEEILRLNPAQADAHFNLAVALSQRGRADDAIRHFQETLRLDPHRPEARNLLGAAFQRQGRVAEAIREFQEALRLKPDYADARKNLVVALAAQANPPPPPAASTNR